MNNLVHVRSILLAWNKVLISLLSLLLSRTMCLTSLGSTIAHFLSLKVSQSLTKLFLFRWHLNLIIDFVLFLWFLNVSLFKFFKILLLLWKISLICFLSVSSLVILLSAWSLSHNLILFYFARCYLFFCLDLIFVEIFYISLLSAISYIISRGFLNFTMTFLGFNIFFVILGFLHCNFSLDLFGLHNSFDRRRLFPILKFSILGFRLPSYMWMVLILTLLAILLLT